MARIRIATWNVRSCIGAAGRLAPELTVAVLRELRAELICLQEVPGASWRGRRIAHRLAQELDMDCVLGPTLLRGGCIYGNATLSAAPIADVRRYDLSLPGREPRGLIEISVAPLGRPLRLLNTHLGLQRLERQRQLMRVAELVHRVSGELLVLAGDINEWWPESAGVRRLEEQLGRSSTARTFPARLPLLRLDRIWCSRPGAALAALAARGPLIRRASDHLPLYLDLELPPGTGPALNPGSAPGAVRSATGKS